jgi:hypothetical protein
MGEVYSAHKPACQLVKTAQFQKSIGPARVTRARRDGQPTEGPLVVQDDIEEGTVNS